MADNPLVQLKEHGQSVWYDNIRRGLIQSGELQRMIQEDGITGVTSNPTIFDKAIVGSTDYEEALQRLIESGMGVDEMYEALVVEDIRSAADVLRPVFDATDGLDGFVSLEVSPLLAHDTEETIVQARHLFALINRPNLMIKVPATPEGIPAIETLIGEGINVNVTLIFSLDTYHEVIDAYLSGLERLAGAGRQLNRVASVASFFVSRVDTAVDNQLEALIARATDTQQRTRAQSLLGKIAIANSKMAYRLFQTEFSGPRFKALEEKGARVQRVLWASTSTKNPAYSDVLYIENLIGPHTVNTMAPESITAFRDHGRVRRTVDENVEEAEVDLRALAELGIDLDAITENLLAAGVDAFAQSFSKLRECIMEKRQGFLTGVARRQEAKLGPFEADVKRLLREMDKNQLARRLWSQDASLWSADEKIQAAIKNRLGWLHIAELMRENLDDMKSLTTQVREEGFSDVVLLGMGGSSLCGEVFSQTYGPISGFPRLTVLDTTDPATVHNLRQGLDLARTLFIVSTKSGTTTETLAFYRYFWGEVVQTVGERAGRHFIAITDPQSELEATARERGFRKCYLNPPSIGGRYSVLSYFGLVPATLMGIDPEALLERAERMAQGCAPCVLSEHNPGVFLGAAMAELARQGRDKLTLVLSPRIASFGLWAEQLIAESTGKDGKGIVPVAGEELGTPPVYGQDRFFVYLKLAEDDDERREEVLAKLARAGHPVLTLFLTDVLDLGGEFFRWELATAVAGALLGINPFDEPNVQESKDNTRRVLQDFAAEGRLPDEPVIARDGHLELTGDQATRSRLEAVMREKGYPAGELPSYLAAHLGDTRPGDYLALMAYLPYDVEIESEVQQVRHQLRDHLHLATTVGFGPRFLHSTGQLHKGGPDEGVFIQLTADDPAGVPIPGEGYDFSTLKNAQARGDMISLQSKGLRVVRVHLKGAAARGLRELRASVERALHLLGR